MFLSTFTQVHVPQMSFDLCNLWRVRAIFQTTVKIPTVADNTLWVTLLPTITNLAVDICISSRRMVI